jgi:hypothetical protein
MTGKQNASANADNGIVTRIWGRPMWFTLHCISINYPRKPTKVQKKAYLAFFRSLRDVLPCKACRCSYRKFISAKGPVPLTWKTMKDRRTVSRWLYRVHVQVNKRLSKPNGPSYESVMRRYEKFRAKSCKQAVHGCIGGGRRLFHSKVVIEPCT